MTMRHIFHRILDRYLDGSQAAFDTSPRELWPEPESSWQPSIATDPTRSPSERKGDYRVYRELEPQN